jgi:hypothetical protein
MLNRNKSNRLSDNVREVELRLSQQSCILKTKDGYIQGYNAQAAVDGEAQIIVAHGLVASPSDQDQLVNAAVDSQRRCA